MRAGKAVLLTRVSPVLWYLVSSSVPAGTARLVINSDSPPLPLRYRGLAYRSPCCRSESSVQLFARIEVWSRRMETGTPAAMLEKKRV